MLTLYTTIYASLLLSFSALANSNELEKMLDLSDNTIKLGMSNALSGPAENLGQDLKNGANVYFNNLNKLGGINGHSIELISLDDGYEPENTVNNTKRLIEQKVLALFGYVGTPTSYAIMPILKKSQIPFLMPFTGADFLRSVEHSNILNLRVSYYQEIKAQIEYLIANNKSKRVALVIQADEFGLTAQRAVNKILSNKKLSLILTARYRRNTDDIEAALKQLAAQPVDAVIFVGTYQPFIRLINFAHQQEMDMIFTSLSFIGKHSLLNNIPDDSKVIISGVLPAPDECHWLLCQEFITNMEEAGYRDLNRVQLEGYLSAFVFSQVAKLCRRSLSSQCLLKQFKQFSYQDNTLKLRFDNESRQGLQQVYFSFSKGIQKAILPSSFTH